MAGTAHSTKNNLKLLRKSSHIGHKFLNGKKFRFSTIKNKNFNIDDTKDIHTERANKEAILITVILIIPFAIFCFYWFGFL